MAKIRNIDQLFNRIISDLNKSVDDIGKKGVDILKNQIQHDIYDKNEPESYIRTGELKSSVTYSQEKYANGSVVKVYHDNSMITATPPNTSNNYMGQHHSTASSYYVQKYSEYVAMVINYGESGLIFGEGFWTEPRPYADNARPKFKKEAFALVNARMAKYGYKIR